MGTNYYLMTNNRNLAHKYFPSEYEIIDDPFLGYKIHIAKTSFGWKPLFQRHDKAYRSVKELIDFITIHTDISIYDEYSRNISIEEFTDEVVNWNDKQQVKYYKYFPDGVENKVFGGKDYFVESNENDYDIKSPFDHLEYGKYDKISTYGSNLYSHDIDGYDFACEEFC